VTYKLPKNRYGFIHLIQTRKNASLRINETELKEGDGAYIKDVVAEIEIVSTGKEPAEFLFFDLA
jgi:hypothetical protein